MTTREWLFSRLKRLPGMRAVRFARLEYIARHGGHIDWQRVIEPDRSIWDGAREGATGPRVLIATGNAGHLGLAAMDSLLGVALTLRGAQVDYLVCDEVLPACQMAESQLYPDADRFARLGPKELCRYCFAPGRDAFEATGLTVHGYGAFLTPDDHAEADRLAAETPLAGIEQLTVDGAALGEHALAGALRFFARGDLENELCAEPVLRRYLRAAVLTFRAVSRLVTSGKYEIVVLHHGIYVPQGAAALAARRAGARIVAWNVAYRRHCFIFSHDDTYHHTLMSEPLDAWENLQLTPEQEASVVSYLNTRRTGAADWIWFHERPRFDVSYIQQEMGLDPARPAIGLLTNVVWDAQLHYPARAFPSMADWVFASIEAFARRPELQLVIRVHPAEIHGSPPSRQRLADIIAERYPKLPPNVFVVPPESPISTYALLDCCDAALIYGTKMGVELTSMGIPTIVAGEAWVRGKGITEDAQSPEHYHELLDALPYGRRLDDDTVSRARRYAYHFFFRRMLDLPFMEPTGAWPPYRPALSGLSALQPGATPGLDTICDGILERHPFIQGAC